MIFNILNIEIEEYDIAFCPDGSIEIKDLNIWYEDENGNKVVPKMNKLDLISLLEKDSSFQKIVREEMSSFYGDEL